MSWRGVIEEFRAHLPVTEKTPVVTLHEGNTPLLEARYLSETIGGGRKVYLKYEGLNPTASFKDRGMTVALSLAKERGAHTVICASTGNTSAAAAAYAARAGMKCAVILPKKKIAKGKLAQALMYGAKVIAIKGNFDDALNLVRELGNEEGIAIVNSINPDRIEGQKTAAFEVIRDLGEAPDFHFLPVGNAGNITAYWKGYCEFFNLQRATKMPKMWGFQAAGAAPMVLGKPVKKPETIATAIRIGNPASWEAANRAISESSGRIDSVTDEEILKAYALLASKEGVFVEPASAAGVAGLLKVSQFTAVIPEGCVIVCTVTGHGLKDPDTAIDQSVKVLASKPKKKHILKLLEAKNP
ncbi:MAG: threonine synthase [Verrucomicrobiae bacterium]|nr:threonine synthase [Verrucomicrobiae bacterium]